jgi:hypothetical protein
MKTIDNMKNILSALLLAPLLVLSVAASASEEVHLDKAPVELLTMHHCSAVRAPL